VPNAASHFRHALKHPTNPTVPNRNVKKHVASAGWMKKESQTSFFGTTNLELKKHGWNETPTIGASIAKSTRITLSEIGLGNAEQMHKMEREMTNLQEQYKLVEESYGQDVLNLVLAKGYLVRLLENNSVARYIQQNQPDVFSEFATIVETVSMDK
jgi:hypothetical protein